MAVHFFWLDPHRPFYKLLKYHFLNFFLPSESNYSPLPLPFLIFPSFPLSLPRNTHHPRCCRRPRRQRATRSCSVRSLRLPFSLTPNFLSPFLLSTPSRNHCASCLLAFIDAPQLRTASISLSSEQVQIIRVELSVSRINHGKRPSGCHHNF